jgi:hypothetical protein
MIQDLHDAIHPKKILCSLISLSSDAMYILLNSNSPFVKENKRSSFDKKGALSNAEKNPHKRI